MANGIPVSTDDGPRSVAEHGGIGQIAADAQLRLRVIGYQTET
jgi:hypothetical protein